MIVFSIILMVPVQGIAAEKSTEIEILKDNKKTTTIKTHRASDLHMSDLIKIIDFSSNNENVNFNTLKDSGIKGVMLRIGSSSLEPDDTSISLDTKFESYYQAASDAGLTIGVYFFSQALSENEAKEQAAWVNDNLISKEITLPVAFDYEYSSNILLSDGTSANSRLKSANLSKDMHTKIARTFCAEISSYGYVPIIYCTSDFLVNDIDGTSLSKQYGIWLARYNTSVFSTEDSKKTRYNGPVTMWQCTKSAVINGVDGKCDLDFYYQPKTKVPTVKNIKVSTIKSSSGRKITFNKISSVDGYKIYRSTSAKGPYKKIAIVKKSVYIDKNVKKSFKYFYKVYAYRIIHSITYLGK